MYRFIQESDYEFILSLDRQVYPSDHPITPEMISMWYKDLPQFGLIYEDKAGEIEGVFCIIALNKLGWENVLNGLDEDELTKEMLFDPSKDQEVGLHVYMIDRFTEEKGFYKKCYTDLGRVLQENFSHVRILGVVGWAVSPTGINLGFNKLNRREYKYICDEHVLAKEGQLQILVDPSRAQVEAQIKQGWTYQNRVKLLVAFPQDFSLIWQMLGVDEEGRMIG